MDFTFDVTNSAWSEESVLSEIVLIVITFVCAAALV